MGTPIEYGDVQLIGNAISDLSQLLIARLANGEFDLLGDFTNDLGHHVITGFYDAPSADSGLEQFGEFVAVQAVDEPSGLLLAVVGLCAIFVGRLTRRRRFGRSRTRGVLPSPGVDLLERRHLSMLKPSIGSSASRAETLRNVASLRP